MLININNVTRHKLIVRHIYLNGINHWMKIMQHQYVAQFDTTYTYTLILEGHICSLSHIQKSDCNPLSGPVRRNGYFQFVGW